MNKENNKSAAGLRRSAIAERIRLREEWSELKGTDEKQANVRPKNVLTKKHCNVKTAAVVAKNVTNLDNRWRKPSSRNCHQTDSTLCGVVALVEVGSEPRALPLRAALTALGATVLPAWSPLVTHLIWSQGGCRSTRAKARALASRLVSPLWVEACAAASRRLPEHAFPAAARASDLPSPRTLRRLLKRAEIENIPIADLLTDSTEDNQKLRLRLSSESEQNTSADTTNTSTDISKDTSRDTSKDTSRDTSNDTSIGVESRVNTAPRRALPRETESVSPAPAKSRRKLFTQKEADVTKDSDDEAETMPKLKKPSYKPPSKKTQPKVQKQVDRKELAKAERLARKLIANCTETPARRKLQRNIPRIVLTGMSRSERRTVSEAVKALGGRVQKAVDRHTSHVLLGSLLHSHDYDRTVMTGVTPFTPTHVTSSIPSKPRTVSALVGAARGCRVLYANWALHSKDRGKWLHHAGYEVLHLRKISQNALVERSALGKLHSEYAYDVFCGMRVRIARDADNRDGAIQLLSLCGAIVQDEADNDGLQNGRPRTQNGVDGPSQYYVTQHPDVEFDVKVGRDVGDVHTRWVFDSVACGRMRTARRYVVTQHECQDALFAQLARLGC